VIENRRLSGAWKAVPCRRGTGSNACSGAKPAHRKPDLLPSARRPLLIPLPEAADYEVHIQEKRRRASATTQERSPIDFEAAKAFTASIPSRRWAS
jgi:hypothetical protein